MSDGIRQPIALPLAAVDREGALPPAWREFIRYCRDLRHGEIERPDRDQWLTRVSNDARGTNQESVGQHGHQHDVMACSMNYPDGHTLNHVLGSAALTVVRCQTD